MSSTLKLVEKIKEEGQDFEWYPTTTEILDKIKADLDGEYHDSKARSILDIGAGDGRALMALTKGDKYAIEKSNPLLMALDKSIYVVGTDFAEQTLIDKEVDVIFSNPPYSEYEQWAEKIINEANCAHIYLVIPERWRRSEAIAEAVKLRRADTVVIGDFDFLNADRKARAKVQILKVTLCYKDRYSHSRKGAKTDPFRLWFEQNFSSDEPEKEEEAGVSLSTKQAIKNEITNGSGLVSALDKFYKRDMEKLMGTYRLLMNIDAGLMKELGVEVKTIIGALSSRVKGLKNLYWQELFDNLDKITDRLTFEKRKAILEKLTKNTNVDFTPSNAHFIVIWVIKNANAYFDDQLIDTVESMTDKANIALYKSNQKTFGKEEWRYGWQPTDLGKYLLDYRVVIARMGGLADKNSYHHYDNVNGLSLRAAHFLDDLCVVANNLGFRTESHERSRDFDWGSKGKKEFMCTLSNGDDAILFEAKAFMNGNLHIKFNQAYICKLNVEFGRLKGWLKSHKEAAQEMNIPEEVAKEFFKSQLKIGNSSILKLGLAA